MLTRKTAIMVLLVPLAAFTLLAAGGSGGPSRERGWWANPQTAEPSPAAAKVAPHPAALAAKARLDGIAPRAWHVGWNSQTGLVEELWGPPAGLPLSTPEEAADLFVREYRPLFSGLAPDADAGDITFVRGGTHTIDDSTKSVVYGEHYKGVPVKDATLHVHVRKGWRVLSAGGSPYRIDALNVNPALSAQFVTSLLREALLPDSMALWKSPELVIYPGNPFRLTYKAIATVLVSGHPFPNEFIVDGITGDILNVGPLYIVEEPIYPSIFQQDTTGKADSAGKSSSPPPGCDYLCRRPVFDLPPRESEQKKKPPPPPPPQQVDPRYR